MERDERILEEEERDRIEKFMKKMQEKQLM